MRPTRFIAVGLLLGLTACSSSGPPFPWPVPSPSPSGSPEPSPSPTAEPTPVPTMPPTPTPAPACAPPTTNTWLIEPGTADPALVMALNQEMVSLTWCAPQSDCRTDMGPDEWFALVAKRLHARGLCAGLAMPGEDQLLVGRQGRCGWYQAYHIYNYGGGKVGWAPGSYQDSWKPVSPECGD